VVKRDVDASRIDPTSALFIKTPSPGSSTRLRPCWQAAYWHVGAAMNDRSSSTINSCE
jgi:hypothetical protein